MADRVHAEFRDDLDGRSGKIARLWVCGNILRMADKRADARPRRAGQRRRRPTRQRPAIARRGGDQMGEHTEVDITVEELTTIRNRNAVDGDGATGDSGENRDG